MKQGIPTESGHYWLRSYTTRMDTKERVVATQEIVVVCHSYTLRGKVVPHVVAMHWKCPLSKIAKDSLWSDLIQPPA